MLITKNVNLKAIPIITLCLLAITNTSYAACNIINGKGYGNCSNVSINKGVQGHIIVRSLTSLSGIIMGATIFKNGDLHLSGISNGDITVHHGGHLFLTGTVNGTVKNIGGIVEIEGMLDHLDTTGGQVIIAGNVGSISGTTLIEYRNGAVVNGVPIEKNMQKVDNLQSQSVH